MNKIERAIADCKAHIKHLETEKTLIYAELNANKKQLDNLEDIERNKSIPHQVSDKTQPYNGITIENTLSTSYPNGEGIIVKS